MKKHHQLIDTHTQCNYEGGRDSRFPKDTQKHTSEWVLFPFKPSQKNVWEDNSLNIFGIPFCFFEIFLRDSCCKDISAIIFLAAAVNVMVVNKEQCSLATHPPPQLWLCVICAEFQNFTCMAKKSQKNVPQTLKEESQKESHKRVEQ